MSEFRYIGDVLLLNDSRFGNCWSDLSHCTGNSGCHWHK